MEPTTWALVIAAWVHPVADAPSWAREADDIWGGQWFQRGGCRRAQ